MRHLLAASLLVLSASVLAGEPPRVSAAVDVPVTSVDVVVTKSGSERVTGLTKADFEVIQGGASREIANFSEITSTGSAALSPRRILIAVDNTALAIANRKPYIAAARDFVERGLLPTDEVLVATFTVAPVIKQQWTRDRAAVLRALDQIAGEVPVGRAELQRRRVRQELQGTLSNDAAGAAVPRGSSVSFDALTASVRNYASIAMQETTGTLSSLSRLLRLFPRKPERKLLIIAGEGLSLRPGADMFEYLESVRSEIASGGGGGSATMRRTAQTAAPLTDASEFNVAPIVRNVAADARKLGVVVYTVRPGSSTNSSGNVESISVDTNSSDFAQSAGDAGGYQLLAQQTGGLALIGAAPALAFKQISADLAQSYSLGFRPEGAGDEPVTVRTKAGQVRFAVVSGAMSAEEQVEELVMANHTTPPASNDLNVTLLADPAVPENGKRRLPLKVLIPVRSLTFASEGNEAVGGFDVYISAGDAKGNASDPTKQSHAIRWPAEAVPHLIEKSVTFAVDVVMEKGRTQLSVGVIDITSKKTGFAVIAIP